MLALGFNFQASSFLNTPSLPYQLSCTSDQRKPILATNILTAKFLLPWNVISNGCGRWSGILDKCSKRLLQVQPFLPWGVILQQWHFRPYSKDCCQVINNFTFVHKDLQMLRWLRPSFKNVFWLQPVRVAAYTSLFFINIRSNHNKERRKNFRLKWVLIQLHLVHWKTS